MENVYHVWPCDTVCTPDQLEDMLEFMSDDYLTAHCDVGDMEGVPTYNDIATLLSF